MRIDEHRPGMLAEHAMLLGDDRRPGRVFAWRTCPLGALLELQPTLVVLVVRLEELPRLRGVNEDGNAELARLPPERVETRIVDGNPLPRTVLEVEPEILEDLEAAS